MSKVNPLASLISNYGDSDEESDSESTPQRAVVGRGRPTSAYGIQTTEMSTMAASIHPSPIAHCPWSACYDESSGFTYYWNQQTNAVTWDAPPEYLLALKLAQQQLHSQGSAEVSVEEWQLYQQALAEKQQSKVISKGAFIKPIKNNENTIAIDKNKSNNKKRKVSDVEEEKIELITSYYNSDSESNEESESPVKAPPTLSKPKQPPLPKVNKIPNKKIKSKPATVPFGPTLPQNQDYSVPIGPELPPEEVIDKPKSPEKGADNVKPITEVKKRKSTDTEDGNDELLIELKKKAKLLEKLGGELPSGLQEIIEEETKVLSASPLSKDSRTIQDNIDDLLNEIETNELPKIKTKKLDMCNEVDVKPNSSPKSSPHTRDMTPPIEQRMLFPSVKNISPEPAEKSIINIETNSTENPDKVEIITCVAEKKRSKLISNGY